MKKRQLVSKNSSTNDEENEKKNKAEENPERYGFTKTASSVKELPKITMKEDDSSDEEDSSNPNTATTLSADDDDDVYISDEEIEIDQEEEEDIEREEESSDEEDVKVFESFTNLTSINDELEDSWYEKSLQKKSKNQTRETKEKSLFADVHDSDDSSEDEGMINTIGNVPLEWYEEYDHIGYDRSGNKILKKKQKDALDNLIAKHDDPNYLRTVYDEYNDKEHVLSNEDLETIINIGVKGQFPPGYNPYKDYEEYVKIDSRFPMYGNPVAKSKFLPNKSEMKMISKIALRYKRNPALMNQETVKPKKDKVYLMWGEDGQILGEKISRIGILPPPKEKLPGHNLSYNPPPEYIPEKAKEGKEFKYKIYDSLRSVPVYDKFIQERFERCMDLYLAPRVQPMKKKNFVEDPDTLLPQLPKPEELRPYPEIQSLIYEGHEGMVRSISVDPSGKWLVSCSDEDGTVRLWEVDTGRCRRVWNFLHYNLGITTDSKSNNEEENDKKPQRVGIDGNIENVPKWVEWNPNAKLNLFAVAVGSSVFLIKPEESGNEITNELTEELFPDRGFQNENGDEYDISDDEEEQGEEDQTEKDEEEKDEEDKRDIEGKSRKGRRVKLVTWKFYRGNNQDMETVKRRDGIMCQIIHKSRVTQVTWHQKGDYFSSLAPNSYSQGVLVHQLSHRSTQKVFKENVKVRNASQKFIKVQFHPKKPHFYVVSTSMVRIYNLQTQRLSKKLKGQKCNYVSSIAIHPSGEHVLIGGFDERMEWFDLAISSHPYKTMRFHTRAIRNVDFHKRYPLFATCSDDTTANVFHGQVYTDDWTKETQIVPVKILRGHKKRSHLGVLDCKFHPIQPWLFTAGSDKTIRLWTS
ncbi:ribosome biogenesis protein bop1 [Naegleria gruberi]|uniref:Ribosome biogenesis protein BOP1 homolog n=1 Tax=Naegleria gruberi TaxID=5762 RepID=D2UXU6_NAEGR|nr:ribosome biogenesis protein bop1 [Naegleria gruberi]EFC50690.1 ribosome biogenesis protein bop1 [Naegleria gruberi]|eukprot:XP_002683434.1 ribosome biogenesis protein bop1 [Naegleria gruberi strain NEG-M]